MYRVQRYRWPALHEVSALLGVDDTMMGAMQTTGDGDEFLPITP
jgi:hypothetical protein